MHRSLPFPGAPLVAVRRRRCRPSRGLAGLWILLAGLALWAGPVARAAVTKLDAALPTLAERSFKAKQDAVTAIADSGDERAVEVLRALLKGDLYYRKDDKRIVLATRHGDGYRITDAATGADLGEVAKRDVTKVITDNQMRSRLRSAIASLSLNHPKAAVRLAAVDEMLDRMDAETAKRFRERLAVEKDQAVRSGLEIGIALADLGSADPQARQAAAHSLAGSLEPVVRIRLETVASADASPEVRAAAKKALETINLKLRLDAVAETLFFGLSLGSVLVLAAIGLAITFGVMGVINMAHGELIMIGAYTTYMVQQLCRNAVAWLLVCRGARRLPGLRALSAS